MSKQVVLWGAAGGVLIALLKILEYKHFVHEYPSEMYGGLVALIFTAIGIYLGLKWTRTKEVVVVKEVPVRGGPFVLNETNLRDVGLTQREHEILGLIAQGRSNRWIASHLTITKRAVERHINAIFLKLDLGEPEEVNRRVQAALLFLSGDRG